MYGEQPAQMRDRGAIWRIYRVLPADFPAGFFYFHRLIPSHLRHRSVPVPVLSIFKVIFPYNILAQFRVFNASWIYEQILVVGIKYCNIGGKLVQNMLIKFFLFIQFLCGYYPVSNITDEIDKEMLPVYSCRRYTQCDIKLTIVFTECFYFNVITRRVFPISFPIIFHPLQMLLAETRRNN